MIQRRDQQHDDRGDRGGVQAGIEGCDESQRRDRQHQQRQQCTFPGMRNQYRDGAAIDRAADGPEHIITGRLERPADAHLGYDQGGQHRPQRQQQMQRQRDHQRAEGRHGDPDSEA